MCTTWTGRWGLDLETPRQDTRSRVSGHSNFIDRLRPLKSEVPVFDCFFGYVLQIIGNGVKGSPHDRIKTEMIRISPKVLSMDLIPVPFRIAMTEDSQAAS